MKAKIINVTEFKKGDILSHENNFNLYKDSKLLPIFFVANEEDVKGWSGKNGTYKKAKFTRELSTEEKKTWLASPKFEE